MQTVILWTEYDGTPETLPEEWIDVLLCRDGHVGRKCYRNVSGGWDYGKWFTDYKVGDMWAPWPEAPQGAE